MPLKIKTLFLNLLSNLTYYFTFQILINFLFLFSINLQTNKLTGENILLYYITIFLGGIYLIPISILTWTVNIIYMFFNSNLINDKFYSLFLIIGGLLSTLIISNIIPYSKQLKSVVKINNNKIKILINILLIMITIVSTYFIFKSK